MLLRVSITVLVILHAISTQAHEFRDRTGKFRVEAEIIFVGKRSVTLRRSDNGAEVSVAIDRLRLEDREFIRDYESRNKTQQATPNLELMASELEKLEVSELRKMLTKFRQGSLDSRLAALIDKQLVEIITSNGSDIPIESRTSALPSVRAIPLLSSKDVRTIVQNYLVHNANDPTKVEIVAVGIVLPTAPAYKWKGGKSRDMLDVKALNVVDRGFWEAVRIQGSSSLVKYRSTNRLGALVISTNVFCISDGRVVDVIAPSDFRKTKPIQREDQHLRDFLDK